MTAAGPESKQLPDKAYDKDDLVTTHLAIFQLKRLYKFDFTKLVEKNQLSPTSVTVLSEERDAFVFNCFSQVHHCDYKQKNFWIKQFNGALFLKGKGKRQKSLSQFGYSSLQLRF